MGDDDECRSKPPGEDRGEEEEVESEDACTLIEFMSAMEIAVGASGKRGTAYRSELKRLFSIELRPPHVEDVVERRGPRTTCPVFACLAKQLTSLHHSPGPRTPRIVATGKRCLELLLPRSCVLFLFGLFLGVMRSDYRVGLQFHL
jgi:hypothetical protein